MKTTLLIISVLLLMLLLGGARSHDPSVVPSDSDAGRAVLAYDRSDSSLAMQAYAWRDFMPGSPGCAAPGARALRLNVTVRGLHPESLPAGSRLTSLAVLYGDEVWIASAEPSSDCGPDSACVGANARSGPAWPTGARIRVIARIALASGHEAVVADSAIEIVRTE